MAVLMVFSDFACREYLLGNGENGVHQILLDEGTLRIRRDVRFELAASQDGWLAAGGADCFFTVRGERRSTLRVKEDHMHSLETVYGDRICFLLHLQAQPRFPVMQKLRLDGRRSIGVGTAGDNAVRYSFGGRVSRHHCTVERGADGWYLCDQSKNGTYLNNSRTGRRTQLHYGAVVYIFGLKLCYFGTVLGVCSLVAPVEPDWMQVREYDVRGEQWAWKGDGRAAEPLNRSPRNLPSICTDQIRIDPPPQLAVTKRRPLIATIGPSMTMSVPMVLGCVLMAMSMGGRSSFMFLGVITSVSSAVLGAVWAVLNLRREERENREQERRRFNDYGNYLIERARQLAQTYDLNRHAMLETYPSARQCAESTGTSGLWNRNRTHPDFLFVRLGLGDVPFQVDIQAPTKGFSLTADRMMDRPELIRSEYQTLREVPVGVDLLKHPLMGIVGRGSYQAAVKLTQVLLAQIACQNCYTDVKIVLLSRAGERRTEENWGFLRRLPHCWSEDHSVRYYSASYSEAEDISYEMTKVLRMRASSEQTGTTPHYVIVLTDVGILENSLLSSYLLNPREKYAVTTLILSDAYSRLPNTCSYAVETNGSACSINDMMDANQKRELVVQDQISPRLLDALSKRLANLRVEEKENTKDIPTSVEFLEMYGVSSISELKIGMRWRSSRIFDSIRVPIGIRAGGELCCLDIHEKYHGPHGLVAGTTGSGKSETLQSYILSLCVNFSPEDITFFLIDYKGGGMANLFGDLPHLAGQISNLSGNQIHRAMTSIRSESVRRQRLFSECGVGNINQYTRMYKDGEVDTPIPHLLIVIDEFAELKKAEPDFMRELVSVAQVGRSLGVHLILATQKPSGTVDDNIRSNSKFRLCLRVQDRQDSMDMLHHPDAAYITQAGGCILQVGNDEIFEPFQSAWSGAPYDEGGSEGKSAAVILTNTGAAAVTGNRMKLKRMERKRLEWYRSIIHAVRPLREAALAAARGWEEPQICAQAQQRLAEEEVEWNGTAAALGRFLSLWSADCPAEAEDEAVVRFLLTHAVQRGAKLPAVEEQTQLDALVAAIREEAVRSRCRPVYQLWLPVLEEKIYLDRLEGWQQQSFASGAWSRGGAWSLETIIGLADDPANQMQMPVKLNFAQGGHHAVVGTVASGKSTLLQTALYGLVNAYSPERLNLYIIDYSSRMLSVFKDLPHTGGIVFEGEGSRVEKLFHLLEELLNERKKLLQGGSFSEYQRRNPDAIPAVLVVVDNYAGFKEKTNAAYEAQLLQLSREGISYGIFLLLSAAGFGMAEISTRMADNLRTIITLEMTDKFKYAEALRMSRIQVLPEGGIAGRGLMRSEERCLEYQTALINDAEDDYTRAQRARQLFEKMAGGWSGASAREIPEIPENPTYTLLSALPSYRRAVRERRLPVGYCQDTDQLYSLELLGNYCYLILGQPHVGKSNVIQLLLRSCCALEGAKTLLLSGDNTLLSKSAVESGARVLTSESELFAFWKELTPDFVARNKKKRMWLEEGLTEQEVFRQMQEFPPIFILIDDLAAFLRWIYKPSEGVGDAHGFVENILDKGALHNVYFFAAANTADIPEMAGRKAYGLFTREKKGMLVGTAISAQRLFDFGKTSYLESSQTPPKGVGIVASERAGVLRAEKIVLPLASR